MSGNNTTGLILGIVGGVIGGIVAGPMGASAGYMIGSGVGMLLMPDVNNVGPKKDDLHVQGVAAGTSIANYWGTGNGTGNVIECTGIDPHEKTEDVGKGPSTTNTTYSYTATVVIGIGKAGIKAIRRCWANEILIYDQSTANFGNIGDVKILMRFYGGGESQKPDSWMVTRHGAKACAYKDLSYVIFENLPLEKFGQSPPNFRFEVIRSPDNIDSKIIDSIVYDDLYANSTGYIQFDIQRNPVNDLVYVLRSQSYTSGPSKLLIDCIDPITQEVLKTGDTGISSIYGSGFIPSLLNFNSNGDIIINYTDTPVVVDKDLLIQVDKTNNISNPKLPDTDYRPSSMKWENIVGYYELVRRNITGNTNKLAMTRWGGRGITADEYVLFELPSRHAGEDLANIQAFNDKEIYFITHGAPYSSGDHNKNLSLACVNYGGLLNENIVSFYDSETENFNVSDIYYDKATEKVFIAGYKNDTLFSGLTVYKVDLITLDVESVIWNSTSGYPTQFFNADPLNRLFRSKVNYVSGDNRVITTLNMDTFEEKSLAYTITEAGFDILPQSPCCYIKELDCEFWIGSFDTANKKNRIFLNYGYRADYATYPLDLLVKEICLESGLPEAQLDVTGLEGTDVRGYIQTSRCTARALLEQLAIIFNFDGIESNNKVIFKKRGQAEPIKTIDSQELACKIFSDDTVFESDIDTQHTQEADLPKLANLIYLDIDKDYMQNTQESKRYIETTENVMTMETSVVLNADEAKQIIDRIMMNKWVSRDKYQFTTNYDYIDLEPTDIVRLIASDGTNHIVRIMKKDESMGILKFEAEAEEKSVYVQSNVGGTGMVNEPGIAIVAGSEATLLDIPIFGIEDDDFGMYAVMNKGSGSWNGASLQSSETSSGVYKELKGFSKTATKGVASTLLGPVSKKKNTIDWINRVVVVLKSGELSSIEPDEIYGTKNVCSIGGEILQFAHAELIGTNTYELSVLLRHRQGTENYGTHSIGDAFILYEFGTETIKRIERSNQNFGILQYYKAVSYGSLIGDVMAKPFTNNCVGLRPYAVSNVLSGRYDGNIVFSWSKRVRGILLLKAGADGIDPDGDSYEIDILKAGAVVRTLSVNSMSATYTSAQQIIDFGSVQSSVNVNIYKMSPRIGRGSICEAVI